MTDAPSPAEGRSGPRGREESTLPGTSEPRRVEPRRAPSLLPGDGRRRERRLEWLRGELRRRRAAIALPREDLSDRRALNRLATALLRAFDQEKIPLAFELLYEAMAPVLAEAVVPRLIGIASFLSPEEVIAETFYRIYRSPGSFRPRGPAAFYNWSLTIAVNVIRQELRNRQRRARREEIVVLREARVEASLEGNPLVTLVGREDARRAERDQAERLAAIKACFDALPPLTRRCVELAIIDELPYRQIGRRLGLSEGAVTMRVRRARLKAHALLGDDALAPSRRARGAGMTSRRRA